jgi:hypothetical protein
MQLGLILVLVDVLCVVHAAKTGRFWPWGALILALPGFGALAYFLMEKMRAPKRRFETGLKVESKFFDASC